MPAITDITTTLPRNPAGFVKRPLADIKNIVINHTAVRPEVGADRVAAAHMKKWPGIVGHYFITGDGQIQQTNPVDEVVAKEPAWIYNGISVYVAGNFDDDRADHRPVGRAGSTLRVADVQAQPADRRRSRAPRSWSSPARPASSG